MFTNLSCLQNFGLGKFNAVNNVKCISIYQKPRNAIPPPTNILPTVINVNYQGGRRGGEEAGDLESLDANIIMTYNA